MHALPVFRILLRQKFRASAFVRNVPVLAAVFGPENPDRRNTHEHAGRIGRIDDDGMQAKAASTRMPFGSRGMRSQAGNLIPCLAAILAAKESGRGDTRMKYLHFARTAQVNA